MTSAQTLCACRRENRYPLFRVMRPQLIGGSKQEAPESDLRGFFTSGTCAWRASGPGAHTHHEAVIAELGDLIPGIRIIAEGRQALVHLLEVRVGRGELGIDLVGRLVAGLEHVLRE